MAGPKSAFDIRLPYVCIYNSILPIQSMAIEQEDVNPIKDELWPDEEVILTVRQRRVGPGGSMVTPTSVVATNKRIIIINRETLGLRHDIESVPYDHITSVRWEHGIISSSVFLRVSGFSTEKGFLKGKNDQEGEIDGLNNNDAKELSDYVEKMLSGEDKKDAQPPAGDAEGGGGFCSNCGAALDVGSKFCPKCGKKVELDLDSKQG